MKEYNPPLVSILILDFNRPKESELLLRSLEVNARFDYELIYVSNGGRQDYVYDFYKKYKIDKLILSKENGGTGLGTRQGFKSANGKFILYVQCDQWLSISISQDQINQMIDVLEKHPEVFYVDMAGDQGRGNPSERALFINREKYLAIPELKTCYGGPGPWAHITWSEKGLQDYMKREKLVFASVGLVFSDNGKNSIREYPCGGEILQETDTKKLTILKPIKERIDFPNLKLTNNDWDSILSGQWINGTIPELHKDSSFTAWEKPLTLDYLKE